MKIAAFVTLIVAAALVAVALTYQNMDKPNEPAPIPIPDSIAFPLLITESETSRTYITGIREIGKDLLERIGGGELWYLDVESQSETPGWKRVESTEVAGENDIFLDYEIETRWNEKTTGPDSDGISTMYGGNGSMTGTWLRFVPQQDGSYEISRMCVLSEWWDEFGISHADPTGRWSHNGNSSEPQNAEAMRILEIYVNHLNRSTTINHGK